MFENPGGHGSLPPAVPTPMFIQVALAYGIKSNNLVFLQYLWNISTFNFPVLNNNKLYLKIKSLPRNRKCIIIIFYLSKFSCERVVFFVDMKRNNYCFVTFLFCLRTLVENKVIYFVQHYWMLDSLQTTRYECLLLYIR